MSSSGVEEIIIKRGPGRPKGSKTVNRSIGPRRARIPKPKYGPERDPEAPPVVRRGPGRPKGSKTVNRMIGPRRARATAPKYGPERDPEAPPVVRRTRRPKGAPKAIYYVYEGRRYRYLDDDNPGVLTKADKAKLIEMGMLKPLGLVKKKGGGDAPPHTKRKTKPAKPRVTEGALAKHKLYSAEFNPTPHSMTRTVAELVVPQQAVFETLGARGTAPTRAELPKRRKMLMPPGKMPPGEVPMFIMPPLPPLPPSFPKSSKGLSSATKKRLARKGLI